MPDKHSDTDEVRHDIHMKMLSKSDSAKNLGELTAIPLGFAVSIALDLLTSEKRKLLERLRAANELDIHEESSKYNHIEDWWEGHEDHITEMAKVFDAELEQLGEL